MELSPVDIRKNTTSSMTSIPEDHSLKDLHHPTPEEPEEELPDNNPPLSSASSPSKSFTFDAFQPVNVDGSYAQTPMPTLIFNNPPAPRKVGAIDYENVPVFQHQHQHQLQRTTSSSSADEDSVLLRHGVGYDGTSSPPLPPSQDAPPHTCFFTAKVLPHSCPPTRPHKTNRGTFIRAKVKRSLNMVNRKGPGGAPLPPQQQQSRISGAFKPHQEQEEDENRRHTPHLPTSAADASVSSSLSVAGTTVAGVARKRFEADLVSPPSLPRKTSRTLEEDGFAADIMSRLSLGGGGGGGGDA